MTNVRLAETPGWCTWDNCRFKASSKYMLTLCDDHIALVLSLVAEADKEASREPAPNLPRTQTIGYVYFLKIGDRLKVGFASDLARRIRQYPPGAELLAVRPGTVKDERVEHSLLSAHRIEGREWFALNAETLEHVQKIVERHGRPPTVAGRRPAQRSGHITHARPGAPSKIG